MQVVAASINPSGVKNVAEGMQETTQPRIPGRDFAGVVEPAGRQSRHPGTGGDAGFTRDGTHTEMIAVPTASLRRKPDTLSFY